MARLVITVEGKNAEKALKELRRQSELLGGSAKRLDSSVRRTDRSLKKFGGTMGAVKSAAGALGVTLGVAGLTAILRGATRAAIEQSQAEAQLVQGLRSTNFVSRQTSQGLRELASSLQQMTTFGDEAIIRAESILLTFTKISGETFPATVRATTDLAARMGTDLNAAAVQLGKALNDPVANLGELGRAGIQFTKDQKEVIKSLFEGGRAAEAQAIILEELTRQFGGSAEAAAKAAGGGYKQLSNAIGDISEGVGSAFLPALDSAGRNLNKVGADVGDVARLMTELVVFPLLLERISDALLETAEAEKLLVEETIRYSSELATKEDAVSEVAARLATLATIQDEEDRKEAARREAEERYKQQLEDINRFLDIRAARIKAVIRQTERLIDVQLEEGPLALKPVVSLPGQIDQLPDLVSDQQVEAAASKFEGLGHQIFGIVSGAIVSALQGDGVNYQQLGSALGTVIGNAIAPGIGGVFGGLIGGVFGGFFGGGGGGGGPSFADQLNALADRIESMFSEVEPIVGRVAEAFHEIRSIAVETYQLGNDATAAFAAAQSKIVDLRNEILGIDVESFGERLRAALELNIGLGLAARGDGIGGGLGVGGGFTPGDGTEGAIVAMAPALQNASASAVEFNSVLGETSERYEVAGINLAAFASQLVAEFSGVSFEFMSVTASAQSLRDAIVEMGFDANVTARLLDMLADAEARRMAELENDVLQRLVNILNQIPGMQEEAARLQQQINQARFQIEVEMINMQLQAMGLMTAAFAEMVDAARAFGADVGNFRAPRVRGIGGLGGGRGRGGGRRNQRAQEREQLLDTLERLANSTAFNTLNDQMRRLMDDFFGPGGFADEARRLGVSIAEVTRAFRVQRQILIDQANQPIRDFLRGLETSDLAVGGQFGAAQSQFDELLSRARAGDLNARQELAGSAQQLLSLARDRYGNTHRYRNIFEQVTSSLEGILGNGAGRVDPQLSELQTQTDLLRIIAGVDAPGRVLPFRQQDTVTAQEVRMLREQNAQLISLEWARQEREHRERLDEARRLRQEVEKQGTKPAVYRTPSARAI